MGAARPLTAGRTHETAVPLDHAEYVEKPEKAVVIKRMRVNPDHCRQGLGSKILDGLESWTRSEGFERAGRGCFEH